MCDTIIITYITELLEIIARIYVPNKYPHISFSQHDTRPYFILCGLFLRKHSVFQTKKKSTIINLQNLCTLNHHIQNISKCVLPFKVLCRRRATDCAIPRGYAEFAQCNSLHEAVKLFRWTE